MGSLMSCWVTRQGECLVTLATLERLLSCMGYLMTCQVTRQGEYFVALVTLERLLPGVASLMLRQALRLCECLITLITLVFFFACLSFHLFRLLVHVLILLRKTRIHIVSLIMLHQV